MQIDIWSDIMCPWCYIGKKRFEKALAAFPHRDQVQVKYHSYQLDPSSPEHFDGSALEYLSQLKGMPQDQVKQMWAQVGSNAEQEGLAFDFENQIIANSFKAHQLVHMAEQIGKAAEVKEALLKAHFVDGGDIGSDEELIRIGISHGLERSVIEEGFASDAHAEDVRADIAQALQLGIQGVPFYVFDMKLGLSGAQPVEVFTQALTQAWGDRPAFQMMNNQSSDGTACGPDGCEI